MDTAPVKQSGNVASNAPTRSPSWWRRAIPGPFKMLVTSTFNELRYWRRINAILAEAATKRQLALADRYAYDRLVDIRLRRRPVIQRAVLRVVSGLMRRPTLTILLIDEAAAVYRRKQEQSISEIARYQDDLEALCRRLGAPLTVIPINGRNADEIARVVVDAIIQTVRERGHPTMASVLSEPIAVTKPAS